MKNQSIILSLILSFLIVGCGSSESRQSGTNYDKMAEELCVCLRPMVEFQKEIMQMVAEGNEEEMMAMSDRAMKIEEDGEACVQALEKKYGVIEGEEQEAKATEAMRKACPDILATLESAAGNPALLEDIPAEELEKMLQELEPDEGE